VNTNHSGDLAVTAPQKGRVCDSVACRSLLSIGSMGQNIGHRSRSLAQILRGLLTAFLTVAYVIVGIGGEISCAQETLEIAGQVAVDVAQDKADQGTKKPVSAVDHCYTCVPLLLPAPVLVAEPSAKPVVLVFATPTFLLEDHPGLDTPPPKHLA
jgi:hypothetical protein